MMNSISIGTLAFALLLLPSAQVTAFSLADMETAVRDIPNSELSRQLVAEAGTVFCARWPATKTRLESLTRERNDRVVSYLENLATSFEEERGARDAKREGLRSEADQLRSAGYEWLVFAAQTEEEKKAAVEYQETVEAALEDRRLALDAAIVEYRSAVDAKLAERRQSMESLRAAFEVKVKKTLSTIDEKCAADSSGASLAETLRTGLSSAKAGLANDMAAVARIEASIRSAAEQRKRSVAAALLEFRSTLETANADLRSAFEAE